MKFNHKKIIIILAVVITTVVIVVAWRYPFGVRSYKGIILGMNTFEKAGESTGWAPPDDHVPISSFYVRAFGDESFCIGAMCGIGGYFIDCLGGWISAYRQAQMLDGNIDLSIADVASGKERVITIADANGKIVGIYPGSRVRNLPFILRNHRDLIDVERWQICSDILPRWWK
ncbi:MAG: hypothetical protein A3J93_01730 [Candidatus Magasanikbacteria bacterium RIFOXYC2_FULL_42_28]|uniref:Uncharacterized protein n=1 Tax=Candidatus Magasanikbacteria bacterium RIFOXYC2_FULL_42_28 TaxID=1798704 RepID=A0A1F6NY96_9BACT|nr:MAG: hypothetical protein A3J93_01730 [Candidatus Magasanikbacteria bacterium RIFOXYC2_FULL_42_28]